jgi:hypothetical protein
MMQAISRTVYRLVVGDIDTIVIATITEADEIHAALQSKESAPPAPNTSGTLCQWRISLPGSDCWMFHGEKCGRKKPCILFRHEVD